MGAAVLQCTAPHEPLMNPEVETQPRTARPTQSRQQLLISSARAGRLVPPTNLARARPKEKCSSLRTIRDSDHRHRRHQHARGAPYCGSEENGKSVAGAPYPRRHRFLFFSRWGANGEWNGFRRPFLPCLSSKENGRGEWARAGVARR
jgi:hypothetical protein